MGENGNSNKYSLEDFRNGSPFQRTVLRDIEEHLENPLEQEKPTTEERRDYDPGGEGQGPLDKTTEERRDYDPGGEGQGPYRLYFSDFRKATLARIVPEYGPGVGTSRLLIKSSVRERQISRKTLLSSL
jgi:hypothetical protein